MFFDSNISADGNFSIQVMKSALEKMYDLKSIPITSEDMKEVKV